MPKVSVVIPAYNAMAYLPETMKSALAQTFDDFEVIVVNDGSSDRIEEWASQITDPRVKLISQTNLGLAGARNTGIAHAEGEYIAFLDADDLWEPTKLEKQVRSFEENPEAGLVYTWTTIIDDKGTSIGRVFANHAEGDVWERLIAHNIVECGSVAMVRRCCFETVGVFEQTLRSYLEDWDMWLRLASRYPFKVVKEPLVYYRKHSSNISQNWEAMEQNYHIIIEKTFDSAPLSLVYLKSRSYGFANLCLAWKPLQKSGDYNRAAHFRQQALMHYPQIRYSRDYIRLSLAIAGMRWLGADSYGRVLALIHALRRYISSVAQ